MIFTTYWFAIAVTTFLLLYAAVKNPQAKKILLLSFCILFHGHFAGAAGVLPIVIVGFIVYFAGRSQNQIALYFAIIVSVTALIWYKYTNFLSQELIGAFSPSAAAPL